jgi:hypothetical protein
MEEEIKLIWTTKEFRDAKEKAIAEGKIKDKCEWCKSKNNLTPHHRTSYKALKMHFIRKLTIEAMAKKNGFTFTQSALYKSGGFSINKGIGYVKIRELGAFMRENKESYKDADKFAREEYLKFNDIQTLCKKCHFAAEKGMELCPYCKKNYCHTDYWEGLTACKDCKPRAREEYADFEKEKDEIEEEMERKLELMSNNPEEETSQKM